MNRVLLATIAALAVMLAGCGITKPDAASAQSHKAKAGGADVSAGDSTMSHVQMIAEFDDIPVPSELSRNEEESRIFEAPGVVVGTIVYEGYFKATSIAKFFRAELPKFNWTFLNAFSEGERHVISFLKDNRSCMIKIEEGAMNTRVTINVGPTRAS